MMHPGVSCSRLGLRVGTTAFTAASTSHATADELTQRQRKTARHRDGSPRGSKNVENGRTAERRVATIRDRIAARSRTQSIKSIRADVKIASMTVRLAKNGRCRLTTLACWAALVASTPGCDRRGGEAATPGFMPSWAEARHVAGIVVIGLARCAIAAARLIRHPSGAICRPAAQTQSAAAVVPDPGPDRNRKRPPVHGPAQPRRRGIAPTGQVQHPGPRPGLGLPPGRLRDDLALGARHGRHRIQHRHRSTPEDRRTESAKTN